MSIKIGDNITYNVTFFYPDQPAVIVTAPVVSVVTQETVAGTYEEYVVRETTGFGSFVSELQLIG